MTAATSADVADMARALVLLADKTEALPLRLRTYAAQLVRQTALPGQADNLSATLDGLAEVYTEAARQVRLHRPEEQAR